MNRERLASIIMELEQKLLPTAPAATKDCWAIFLLILDALKEINETE